jgi:hypothetical protein
MKYFDPRKGKRIFLLAPMSRPVLGPTQPLIQWVQGVLFPGVKRGRGVTLTAHPHLVPRSRMSRNYTSSPPSASMACSGTAYLLSTSKCGKVQRFDFTWQYFRGLCWIYTVLQLVSRQHHSLYYDAIVDATVHALGHLMGTRKHYLLCRPT